MDRIDLANLYATGEFSDCSVISSDGQTFAAHRFVFSGFPRLKELLTPDHRVPLQESKEVVERLLGWLYGVEWAPDSIELDSQGIGKALTETMSLVEAAEKYEIPTLADDAYETVGTLFSQITDGKTGLHVLRDLTAADTAAGALQRTLIDRLLVLLPGELPRAPDTRKREQVAPREGVGAGEEFSGELAGVKRSKRVKRPSVKVSENEKLAAGGEEGKGEAGRRVQETKATLRDPASSKPVGKPRKKLHCVCRKPEDDYMVQCERCEKWFHPHCVGKGRHPQFLYEIDPDVAFGEDEQRWRDEEKIFTCRDCD